MQPKVTVLVYLLSNPTVDYTHVQIWPFWLLIIALIIVFPENVPECNISVLSNY